QTHVHLLPDWDRAASGARNRLRRGRRLRRHFRRARGRRHHAGIARRAGVSAGKQDGEHRCCQGERSIHNFLPPQRSGCATEMPRHTTRRPWMTLSNRTTIATTSRMWMNPPRVYELTIPSSQRMTSTTISVSSMCHDLQGRLCRPREIEEQHSYQRMLSRNEGPVKAGHYRLGYRSFFACALDLDEVGLADSRSRDALLSGGSRARCERRDLHDFPRLSRFIEGLHDAHVLQSVLT